MTRTSICGQRKHYMTTQKNVQVTASNRGVSEAVMELNDAFRLVDKDDYWMESAKCRNKNDVVWFPAQGKYNEIAIAKKFCDDCRVKQRCLQYAVTNNIMHGVWGGLSARDRRLMPVGAK